MIALGRGEGGTRAEDLIAELERAAGASCLECAAPLCGHALLASRVLGAKREPRCLACLARALGRGAPELTGQIAAYVRHRDCYRAAWIWAAGREPACATARALDAPPADGRGVAPPPESPAAIATIRLDAEWDAGALGCGELVMGLRLRLRALAPRQILRLTARDAGAPIDLPAWCGLTGHVLVALAPPVYLIAKKEE